MIDVTLKIEKGDKLGTAILINISSTHFNVIIGAS